jgi:hypothetical protein
MPEKISSPPGEKEKKMLLYDCVDQGKIPALPHGVFDIQNVADYVYEMVIANKGNDIDCIPINCRLPFPESTWFEFQVRHMLRAYDGKPLKCGVLALNSEEYAGEKQKILVLVFYPEIRRGIPIRAYRSIVLCDDEWKPSEVKQDDQGKKTIRRHYDFSPELRLKLDEEDKAKAHSEMDEVMFIVFLALNFLNCKNVVPLENKLPRQITRARRRKNKPYFEKFHTLVIESAKKMLNDEGQAQTRGLSHAMHICRGHFKTYDKKGLFGKYKGTFWVSPHVRGNRDIGLIHKNYELRGWK